MKKIILDCDPGIDDAFAMAVLLASREVDVLGVTTVAGNQTGDKTFKNALKLLSLLGRPDIPVSRGFDRPLVGVLKTAPHVHGESGLGDVELEEPETRGTGTHAVDFIVNTILNSKEKVYLVPIGPLTNIAVALLKEPRIKEKVEGVVMMGGAIHDSNVTPAAEFNIYVDPEAAKIVFESGLPIVMVGLDVTNRATLTREDMEYIASFGGRVSRVFAGLLGFYLETNRRLHGFTGAPIHDALAASYLVDESVLALKPLHVDIETCGEFTRGRTVVDTYSITGKPPNAQVAVDFDREKFRLIIFNAIKYFG